jgi:predicted 2-oxoglutarate/Fe(II)-dependent dioxygenase YbiX
MFFSRLADYIHVERGAISQKTCDSLLETLGHHQWQPNSWYEHASGATYSEATREPDILFATEAMHRVLVPAIRQAAQSYVQKFAYRDSPRTANIISRFSSVRFNRYSPGQQMRKHHDHIHAIFDGQERGIPVLSLVGNLNDNYEGGELAFFEGDTRFALRTGDICMFPSSFLYPHEALEVTSGQRYSFALWAW